MRFLLIAILFTVSFTTAFSEETYEIVGYAPRFVGEKVTLYTYQDYITMTKIEIGSGFVSPKDSLFRIELKNKSTIKGIININKTEAELYLAPKTNYDIYFLKAIGQPDGFQIKKTELVYFNLDSTDINYRIIQYNSWFDMYVSYNEKTIGPSNFHFYLDTFKTNVENAYRHVDDQFFLTYVRYNIAEMDQVFNSKGENKLNTFLTYIKPYPLYFENDQYMRFVKRFYSTDFGDYIPEIENAVFLALANSSPTKLMAALKKDLFLANPELREMMMVDKLGRAYYNEPQFQHNILTILDSVIYFTKFEHNSIIAQNIKGYLTNIEAGYPAPSIKLARAKGDTITWKSFEGKFVYLHFFETWSEKAIAEMRIMTELIKKYNEDIVFLSLCTDKDSSTFNDFKKNNPAFNWDIIYLGRNHDLVKRYKVVSVPAYFLIDQYGYLVLSPAPTPSPDGEYESIDKTFFYIHKMLHPQKTQRIGAP